MSAFTIDGIPTLINTLDNLGAEFILAIARAQDTIAQEMAIDMKVRTATPPTAPKGFFSKRRAAIPKAWQGRVQQHGVRSLGEEITAVTHAEWDEVVSEIGYPEGFEATKAGRVVQWIMDGTVRMQPRPFMAIVLENSERVFKQALLEAGRGVVESFPPAETPPRPPAKFGPEPLITANPRGGILNVSTAEGRKGQVFGEHNPYDPGFKSTESIVSQFEEGIFEGGGSDEEE